MTKVEAIVVIAIAVLVLGIDTGAILYWKTRNADVATLSEVARIQSALEVFLSRNNYYPRTSGIVPLNDSVAYTDKLCVEGWKRVDAQCTTEILSPIPNRGYTKGNRYYYQSQQDGAAYALEFTIGTNFKKFGYTKGILCATPDAITNQPCFTR